MTFDTTITNSVTTSINNAAYADGATLSGTWTANYNSTGGLVSATAATFTVSGPGGTNTFTDMGTLPYAQDPTSAGFTSYEIHNLNASGSGTYNSLYIDWKTEAPSSFYEGSPSLYTSIQNSAVSTTESIRLTNDGTSGTGTLPVISGLPATESGTDSATLKPFAGVTVTNSDTPVSATIVLSNNGLATDADGVLSDAGLTKIATGTYSLTSHNLASLNARLHALKFTPTQGQVAAGHTVATEFTLSINDEDGSASASTTLSVTAACFLRGTRIATPGGEVDIERLAIGDLVLLQSGQAMPVKWIGRHAHARRFAQGHPDIMPILIAADALSDGVPARDLYVSPKHAMFIDGVFMHADELLNGRSVTQVADLAMVEYFHVELDRHGVIMAEGAPTESYVAFDNRHRFHNAAEFHSLYPDADDAAASFCAPLVEHGPLLDAARLRIALRAGCQGADPVAPAGELLGYLDSAIGDVADGWAIDSLCRDAPVRLEIYDHGVLVASAIADRYRPDLAGTPSADGRAGFKVRLPPAEGRARAIEVRRAQDGAVLGTASRSPQRAAA